MLDHPRTCSRSVIRLKKLLRSRCVPGVSRQGIPGRGTHQGEQNHERNDKAGIGNRRRHR
jgi:hypothetical protein